MLVRLGRGLENLKSRVVTFRTEDPGSPRFIGPNILEAIALSGSLERGEGGGGDSVTYYLVDGIIVFVVNVNRVRVSSVKSGLASGAVRILLNTYYTAVYITPCCN